MEYCACLLPSCVSDDTPYARRYKTDLRASLIALAFNVFLPRLLDKVSRGLLIWNICAFLIIVVTILAVNDHKQPASFVFQDFYSMSGFNPAYTAIIGLLQTAFGMCCYDAPAHMTEEIKHARKQAPRAIILSVYLGGVTGFVFLVAACFCMGSIEATAGSSTGVPIIEIFQNSTQNVAGSTCLTVLLIVICVGASNALTAEGGRAVFAFARDRGLPFSDIWSKVENERFIPVYALCLTVVVQIALNSIVGGAIRFAFTRHLLTAEQYFGTLTGFNTVVSIATEGFCQSTMIVKAFVTLADILQTSPTPSLSWLDFCLFSLQRHITKSMGCTA
jgi:choline transport protein